jgi:L-threonylcarbamoyladenylate synthase
LAHQRRLQSKLLQSQLQMAFRAAGSHFFAFMNSIEYFALLAKAGQIFAFPTETVYGLGADACNGAAVAQIFAAKARPSDHPLIVHVASAADVAVFADDVPDFAHALMQAFWPGPLTLILQRRPGIAAAAAGGQDSIGLRCPSHPQAQALLKACAALGVQGLAAPSANRFGRISPSTAAHVLGEFGDALPVLDGGPCSVGIESCIIDCTRGVPILLRPGVLTRAQIEAACGLPVQDKDAAAPKASGTLAAHYAPQAQLHLVDESQLKALLCDVDAASKSTWCVYWRDDLDSQAAWLQGVRVQHMPTQALKAAELLFADFHALDAEGYEHLAVQCPPDDDAWAGVRDRLQRASAASSIFTK